MRRHFTSAKNSSRFSKINTIHSLKVRTIVWLFVLLGISLVLGWPSLVRAMPLSTQDQFDRVWSMAREVGQYDFSVQAKQTANPTLHAANIGRSPETSILTADGSVNVQAEEMEFNLTSESQPVQIRVVEGITYGRTSSQEEWARIDDTGAIFAPGNDLMGFSSAAVNVKVVSNWQSEIGQDPVLAASLAEATTLYEFDIDGVQFARYMRQQTEAQMIRDGELLPGMTLGATSQFADMTGRGQLWVDANGLPIYQRLELEVPPERNDLQSISAEIVTQFHSWEQSELGQSSFGIFARVAADPSLLINDPAALLPTGENITPANLMPIGIAAGTALLILATIMSLYLLVRYNQRQTVYRAFSTTLVFAMIVGPLLQATQVSAFNERLIDRYNAEHPTAVTETITNPLEAEETFNPIVNPLGSDVLEPAVAPQTGLRSTENCDLTDADEDCDGDGLTNRVEIFVLGTNPSHIDTDGDLISDRIEVEGFNNGRQWYLNPNDVDTNHDGLLDFMECTNLIDVDLVTQAFNGDDVSNLTCEDTDSDGTPDVFDYDNDGDGVPDGDDRVPSLANDIALNAQSEIDFRVDGFNSNETMIVDFQIRPDNPDHLWRANQTFNWPENDRQGQITMINGEIQATPLLEIRIPAPSSNSNNKIGSLPSTKALGAIGNTDTIDTWLDTDVLELHGVNVTQAEEGGELLAYVPLTTDLDQLTDSPVSWSGRMVYNPTTTQWGANHEVRLVWFITGVSDYCDTTQMPTELTYTNGQGETIKLTEETDIYERWCNNTNNWTSRSASSVFQVYNQDFNVVSMSVTEYVDVETAVIAQTDALTSAYEDDLWRLADGLEESYMEGYAYNNGGSIERFDLTAVKNRFDNDSSDPYTDGADELWGIPNGQLAISLQTGYRDQAHAIQGLAEQNITHVLTGTYGSSPDLDTDDLVNLMILREEQTRIVSLNSPSETTISNGAVTFDLSNRDVTVRSNLKLSPYQWNGADWEPADAFIYLDETLPALLDPLLLDSDITALLESGEAVSDMTAARDGLLSLATLYYMGLYQGFTTMVELDGSLMVDTASATPSDYLIPDSAIGLGLDFAFVTLIGELAQYYSLWTSQLSTEVDGETVARPVYGTLTPVVVLESFGRYDPQDPPEENAIIGGSGQFVAETIKKVASEIRKRTYVDPETFSWQSKSKNGAMGVALVSGGIMLGTSLLGVSGPESKFTVMTLGVAAETFGAIRTTGEVLKAKESVDTWWFDHLNDYQKASKVSMVVDIAINTILIWAMFTYTVLSQNIEAGTVVFNTLLSETIGQFVVAIVSAIIAAIFPVGTVIIAVVGIIDAIIAGVCALVDLIEGGDGTSEDVDRWVCGGISGAVASALAESVYDSYITVDLNAPNRLEMAFYRPEFQTSNGFQAGAEVKTTVDITNTLTLGPFDGILVRNSYSDSQLEAKMRRSAFGYYLQESKVDHHDELEFGSVSWPNNQQLFSPSITVNYGTPGVNKGESVILTESYNVVMLDCWGFIFTSDLSCDEEAVRGSTHTPLNAMILDILPTSINEFFQPSISRQSGLGWISQVTQNDIDNDGVPNSQDPSLGWADLDRDGLSDYWEKNNNSGNAVIDTDGDGLGDYWEAFFGTNARLADTDRDGLLDGEEFPHSNSRSPHVADTTAWSGGWEIVYDYDNNGDPLTTWVWSDPLSADSDGDSMLDSQEEQFRTNPAVVNTLNPITFVPTIQTVSAQAGIVALDDSVIYSATVKNEDQFNSLAGTFYVELPENVVRDTESIASMLPATSQVVNGSITPGTVAETTNADMVFRAEVVFDQLAEDETAKALYHYSVDEFTTTGEWQNTGTRPYIPATCDNTIDSDTTAGGCPQSGVLGKMGRGVSFATGAPVQAEIPYTFDFDDDQFTMGLWVALGRPGGERFLMGRSGSAVLSLTTHRNVKLSVTGGATCDTTTEISAGKLTTYEWSHIMATYDGATMRVYINGALTQSTAHTTGVCDQATNFLIGDGTNGGFVGRMDEIVYFDYDIGAAAVDEIYDAQLASFEVEYTAPIVIDLGEPQATLELNQDLPNESIILSMIVTDDVSIIDTVAVSITTPANQVITPTIAESVESNNLWIFQFDPSGEGAYSVEIESRDAVGNVGIDSATIYVDNTPPQGAVDAGVTSVALSTNPESITGDNTIELNGTITDNRGLVPSITIDIENWLGNSVIGTPQVASVETAAGLSGVWTDTYSLSQPAYGEYDVVASMEDVVGNTISTTIGTLQLDDYGPFADITATSTYISGTGTISGTVSETVYDYNGRIFHFHFDEANPNGAWVDGTADKYKATCSGAACPQSSGASNFGASAQFDGTDDYLTVDSQFATLVANSAIPTTTFVLDDMTLSAWIYPTWGASSNGYNPTIMAVDDGTSSNFRWQIADDYSSMLLVTPSDTESVAVSISPNEWTHVALSLESGQWVGYVNGLPTAQVTQTLGTTDDLPLHIGADNSSTGFFTGRIDETVVYRHALGLTPIYNIANLLSTDITKVEYQARHLNGAIWPDVDPDGLKMYLPLDDPKGVTDFSHTSLISSTVSCDDDAGSCPTAGIDGKFGTAVQFDGVNDYIEIPDTADLDYQQMAVSFWIKTDNTSFGDNIIAKGRGGWQINMSPLANGKISFDTEGLVSASNGSVWVLDSNASVVDNQWHHVVAMYDGTYKTIYIDGVQSGTQEVVGSMPVTDKPLILGANFEVSGIDYIDALNGSLDEVIIFNRVLTEAEIQSLYTHETWQEATVTDAGGTNYASWAGDLPAGLEGLYTIGLRATDAQGNIRHNPNAWSGPIDLRAPRVDLQYIGLPDDNVQVYCYAEDLNITDEGWVCPAGVPVDSNRQSSDWYLDYFSPVTRTVSLASNVFTINTTDDGTMTACDLHGNCTTVVEPKTDTAEGVAILSPVNGTQLDNFDTVPVTSYAWTDEAYVSSVHLYVNGEFVGSKSWSTSERSRENSWSINWTPPEGIPTFDMYVLMFAGSTIGEPVTNTNTVLIDAPTLRFSNSVSPTIVSSGDAVTYTVVVANNGTNALTGVNVTKDLPAGVAATTAITELNETIDLAVGEAMTFTIPVTVTAAQGASVTSTATVDHVTFTGSDDAMFEVCNSVVTVTNGDRTNNSPLRFDDALDLVCDGGTLTFSPDLIIYPTGYLNSFTIDKSVTIDGTGLNVQFDNSENGKPFFDVVANTTGVVFRNLEMYKNGDFSQFGGGADMLLINSGAEVTLEGITMRMENKQSHTLVRNYGVLNIIDSSINGAAVNESVFVNYGSATLSLENSILNASVENQANGLVLVSQSTLFAGNMTWDPGYSYIEPASSGFSNEGTVQLSSSILVTDTVCTGNGTYDDQGYNLIANDGSCPSDSGTTSVITPTLLHTSVISREVINKGHTYSLLPSSPALDVIPAGTNDCGTYFISDQQGVARPQNGSCDIGAYEAYVNTAATVVDDTATMTEDTTAVVDVLVNDSDVDSDSLIIESVTQPASGLVTIINGGTELQVAPIGDMYGELTFTYIVSDGTDLSDRCKRFIKI